MASAAAGAVAAVGLVAAATPPEPLCLEGGAAGPPGRTNRPKAAGRSPLHLVRSLSHHGGGPGGTPGQEGWKWAPKCGTS